MSADRLRIGIDAVDIPGLGDMLETSGQCFLDLCWTTAEQNYCGGSVPRLAARWAAKEATMKAIDHGIGEVDPVDIEVVAMEGQSPRLHLLGSARRLADQAGLDIFALSLCHEANFALAFVVALHGPDA